VLIRIATTLLSVFYACSRLVASDPIAVEQFDQIRAQIAPQDGESKYLDEVPWLGTLWDARKKAAAEGKPLFVFATGYHPLGVC